MFKWAGVAFDMEIRDDTIYYNTVLYFLVSKASYTLYSMPRMKKYTKFSSQNNNFS